MKWTAEPCFLYFGDLPGMANLRRPESRVHRLKAAGRSVPERVSFAISRKAMNGAGFRGMSPLVGTRQEMEKVAPCGRDDERF
jgi:hypothetical protein